MFYVEHKEQITHFDEVETVVSVHGFRGLAAFVPTQHFGPIKMNYPGLLRVTV